MKQGVLGIYDRDVSYACHLMEYLNQKPDFCLEARVFTSLIRLKDYLAENRLEFLLLGEGITMEGLPVEKIQTIGILTEHSTESMEDGCPLFYKFQSMERLMKELSASCRYLNNQSVSVETQIALPEKRARFIGVVSPFGGSGKTLFSIALGQAFCGKAWAEKARVSVEKALYIGLEPVSSFWQNRTSGNFSDLLYWVRERKEDLATGISSIVEQRGGLDFVDSPDHYEDLNTITKEDMEFFLEGLAGSSYETVIFDIGYWSHGVVFLLEQMDRIYMPDFLNRAGLRKKESFMNTMKLEKREALCERAEPVALPFDKAIYEGNYHLDKMEKTQMGQFVWELIKKDFL